MKYKKIILEGNSTQEEPIKIYLYDEKYIYYAYNNFNIKSDKQGKQNGKRNNRSD